MFEKYHSIAFERTGRILWIILNKPDQLNSIDDDLHRELATVFADADRDEGSDVIILAAAGKAFCAGGNMRWLKGMHEDPRKFRRILPDGKRIVFGLLEMEKPIVCALNGAAAGLGATIALMCDIIFMADDARIGDPHVKVGFVAGDGGAVIWPQLIGFARAKEALLTGDMYDAPEAERLGLVNHVVPAHELRAAALAMAKRLANGPKWAIRYTKTTTNIPLRRLAHELMDASVAYEMVSNCSPDHGEALDAFIEKRAPHFQDK